ncbi:hypothetical protein [Demequina maris]|uniref:hypothetical protein n=1 Tax=Demequina maris TaxID=1638982 RepID=UPI0007823D25|nr:hypothetical protein [Demequina maris]
MTIEHTSAPSGAVSRRRIVQGAAWATPAILVATAAPALAASPAVTGGLVLAGVSANQNETVFTVKATAAYVGDGAPHADYPVSQVKMRIAVPAARLGTGTPTTPTAGWTYVSTETVGTTKVVVYAWSGDVTATATTAPLVASIPKTTDRTATSLTVEARGTSNASSVQSLSVTAPVGAYSLLKFNSNPGGYADGTGNPRYTHLQCAILVDPNANTASVVGVEALVTVPFAGVGAGTPSSDSYPGNFTYQDTTVDAASGTHTFRFTYDGGAIPASYTPTPVGLRIPRAQNANGSKTVALSVLFRGKSPDANGALTTLSGTATI